MQQNTSSGIGNIDWLSLVEMFMKKQNLQNRTQKHRVQMKNFTSTGPSPSLLQARSPTLRPRLGVPDTSALTHLPPDCAATIKQFEALRVQLLHQLVHYQTQLLALKIPPILRQMTELERKHSPSKGKMKQSGPNKTKKQISSNTTPSVYNSAKKWEKDRCLADSVKKPNTRRSQMIHQKPKKSTKRASKRKVGVQKSGSNDYSDANKSRMTKRKCQSYQSCLRNSSSSSDSINLAEHLKFNNVGFESLKGKDTHQKSSFVTCSGGGEGNNKSSISSSPLRKLSQLNKKISSAFAFDTATDEAQSSQ